MNIKCLFGHKYTFSQLKAPTPSYSKLTMRINMWGARSLSKPVLMGWLSYGTISKCDRCGKEKEVADKDYPILLPSQH